MAFSRKRRNLQSQVPIRQSERKRGRPIKPKANPDLGRFGSRERHIIERFAQSIPSSINIANLQQGTRVSTSHIPKAEGMKPDLVMDANNARSYDGQHRNFSKVGSIRLTEKGEAIEANDAIGLFQKAPFVLAATIMVPTRSGEYVHKLFFVRKEKLGL